MAKKVSKKKTAAASAGLSDAVKETASAAVAEIERAGEHVLSEVKDGLEAVTDKVAATAKSVSSSQAGQALKTLAGEVEEIGSGMVAAVGRKLDQLRGRVAGPKKKAR